MINRVRSFINEKIFKVSAGLLVLPHDSRDMGWSIESLWGVGYQPKYTEKYLKLKFPAKLQSYNTCGWNSTVGAEENDGGVELDEIPFIQKAMELGLISGDGFSNLRDNEKLLNEWGIPKKGIVKHPDYSNWKEYSDPANLTKEIEMDAATRKSKSYNRITTVENIYRAIDDGRYVKVGIAWRTAFNMSGGFSFPWLLNFVAGFFVGGHAVYIYGYNQNYRGVKAFKVRNSFSPSYGDMGDFWIKEGDLDNQIDKYGAYVNYNFDKDVYKWLTEHQGKVVKGEKSPDTYLIQGDKKRKYDDMPTLIAHGRNSTNVLIVDDEYLKQVELGDPITFWTGGNVAQVKAMIMHYNDLKSEFKKYFDELL